MAVLPLAQQVQRLRTICAAYARHVSPTTGAPIPTPQVSCPPQQYPLPPQP